MKKKLQKVKTLYIKELETKTQFENVMKKCIEDIKEEIFDIQKNGAEYKTARSNPDAFNKTDRARLIEKLISDEKILTLIYDKTFYGQSKKIVIPPELLRDDSDEESKFMLL